MSNLTMLSLFAGSGGFELAGELNGIKTLANSEVEPFPIRVLEKNYPGVVQLGDVSAVKGAEIEPVDIVTFGSPCQSLSVAGKRHGLKHADKGDENTTRSGLFFDALRIIEEMREATKDNPNGVMPRYGVWENVCLKGNTLIKTEQGLIPIKDITTDNTVNINNKSYKVTWQGCTGKKEVMTLFFADGSSVTCTEDHRFLTDEGWVQAKDIIIGLTTLVKDDSNRTFVTRARKQMGECKVYDITVEGVHCFPLKNGIIAHNCGAFSSSKGKDFHRVLEEFCQVKDPNIEIPFLAKWPRAGEIMGNDFSLAWRTLDAQYWGVPQRRKRIYLVCDFDGLTAPNIFRNEGADFREFSRDFSKHGG